MDISNFSLSVLLLSLIVWIYQDEPLDPKPHANRVNRWLQHDYRKLRSEALGLSQPEEPDIVAIPPRPATVQVPIMADHALCGLPLTDLLLPPTCQATSLVRAGRVLLAADYLTLEPGDWLVVVALDPAYGWALRNYLAGDRSHQELRREAVA
ncbi:hypothetical protein [Anthocerotibacter panamensis]|uniref:hypothetical protein n=1 Tax=Anthocerotibacter panamensis TaxID=2857077 RepID=UPI001C405BB9|nr:hypothetical protein [Anthocerotibacter panamensis]